MSFTTWTPPAVASEARPWQGGVWRMVEAQHVASTLKLVDSLAEQQLLETLLDAGKPPIPPAAQALHYLLATPFRYPSRRGGSRFRAASDPGVFYGAGSVHTAAAELGYWRWRFLKDAVDLDRLEPVAHTAFRSDIATLTLDVRLPPLDADRAQWEHPSDYSACQHLAATAREAGLGAIAYRSVRDPQAGSCLALLTPDGFARPKPAGATQTWFLAVTQHNVTWRREGTALSFEAGGWGDQA